MKILITGGAGYLGSILTMQLLQAGTVVRVFDILKYGGRALLPAVGQAGFEFVRGDIRDQAELRAAVRGVDGVVHLAAIVGDPACARSPDTARAVNHRASLDLIAAASEAGVQRFVFASTCSNYGKMEDVSEMATEEHELRPVSLYAETKVAVEESLLSLPTDALKYTILRFATLYGVSPRMRFDLTVNEFVKELLCRHKLVMYGEQFWRPYVHVRDAARAVAIVLAAPLDQVAGQVFNVGDSRENYRKLDLAEILRQRINGEIQFVHKAEDPRDYRVSFARIQERLGFAVTMRVQDGVNEVAEAIESGLLDELDAPVFTNVEG